MAKQIKAKAAFIKKHKRALDEETRRFIMQPMTRLFQEPKRDKDVYGAFSPTGLRVFSVR